MKKLSLLLLLSFTIQKAFTQDSCFHRGEYDLFGLTRNWDSVYLLLDDYVKTFYGCKAPALNYESIDRKKISDKDLDGKIVVLNFWFTKCRPCVAEFPSLNQLAEQYKNRVEFISFALDSKPVLDSFLLKNPFQFTTVALADTDAKQFRILSYPTSIVIDKHWRANEIFTGTQSRDKTKNNFVRISEALDRLLR
jgi:thiol-disulfide isomerase/thioredoxin